MKNLIEVGETSLFVIPGYDLPIKGYYVGAYPLETLQSAGRVANIICTGTNYTLDFDCIVCADMNYFEPGALIAFDQYTVILDKDNHPDKTRYKRLVTSYRQYLNYTKLALEASLAIYKQMRQLTEPKPPSTSRVLSAFRTTIKLAYKNAAVRVMPWLSSPDYIEDNRTVKLVYRARYGTVDYTEDYCSSNTELRRNAQLALIQSCRSTSWAVPCQTVTRKGYSITVSDSISTDGSSIWYYNIIEITLIDNRLSKACLEEMKNILSTICAGKR